MHAIWYGVLCEMFYKDLLEFKNKYCYYKCLTGWSGSMWIPGSADVGLWWSWVGTLKTVGWEVIGLWLAEVVAGQPVVGLTPSGTGFGMTVCGRSPEGVGGRFRMVGKTTGTGTGPAEPAGSWGGRRVMWGSDDRALAVGDGKRETDEEGGRISKAEDVSATGMWWSEGPKTPCSTFWCPAEICFCVRIEDASVDWVGANNSLKLFDILKSCCITAVSKIQGIYIYNKTL